MSTDQASPWRHTGTCDFGFAASPGADCTCASRGSGVVQLGLVGG
ncbi:hypothetical protein [Streptomyces sp. 11x1]|nr:hypothetical protein [Streptomyces sp. 11x1]WNZ06282.1 hypothetical protein P8T65_00835 [Streptomyces sp. 11x1]